MRVDIDKILERQQQLCWETQKGIGGYRIEVDRDGTVILRFLDMRFQTLKRVSIEEFRLKGDQ